MRAIKNTVTRPQPTQAFVAESGEGWEIVRDTLTRDYAVYVAGEYIGSRKTLSEAQTLRGGQG